MLLRDAAGPEVAGEFVGGEVVCDLALEAGLLVHLAIADRHERLEHADGGLEAADLGGGVGDLRLEIGVDIAQADAAERRVRRRGIAARAAHRQKRDVVEDRFGGEQADVAADLEFADVGLAEGEVGLAEVDAGGGEGLRCVPAELAPPTPLTELMPG
jgi:hypothetical protein